ncbi:MAG: cell division protein ZapB [Candidatus Glassbacteria bacterium]
MSYDEKVNTDDIVEASMRNLEVLEERIKSCIEELRDMKMENTHIKTEYGALRGKMGRLEETFHQMKDWEEQREALITENSALKEKLGVIENRIRGLLTRLESTIGQD